MFNRKKTEFDKYNLDKYSLFKSIEMNIQILKDIFNHDDTIIFRHFGNKTDKKLKYCIVFIKGMVDKDMIHESIIRPILRNSILGKEKNTIESMENHVITSDNIKKTKYIDKVVNSIISGNTVLLYEGVQEALIIETMGWESRDIQESEVEKSLRGPREGFTESIIKNLTMIRRRIKTPDLKFRFRTLGLRTKTECCICYIEGIVNEKILKELNKRLDKLEIDGLLDSGYIEELIKDAPFSPFRTIGDTERPDVVAGKILEGRIALLLDGTPVALTLPYIFLEYFQSQDDYYTNFYFSSINRLLRILSFILTISVPAIYTSLITFHQEMIPTSLILTVSASRQGIPFPTILEVFALLLVFEALRETGIRMPTFIGQALSIVGALVLGQAAVEARFVSAPMVIIVAFAGITGLMTPKIKGAVVLLRVIFLLLSSFLGLYGFIFGVAGLLIHLCSIYSFGIPYMSYISTLKISELKDTAIRMPRWYMEYRPKLIADRNFKRQNNGGKGYDK